MGILNVTPDSFFKTGRVFSYSGIRARIAELTERKVDIIDIGAVSTRPGAEPVALEEEWRRLEMALSVLEEFPQHPQISIDTTSASIVDRVAKKIGCFIVNDISAGTDDPLMLRKVGEYGFPYIAMHKRGNPRTMDSLCDYDDVMEELIRFFREFERKAGENGIKEWILDPGLGFAKTPEQCWQILGELERLKVFGRPILIGAADKRFTEGDNSKAEALAIKGGADILRVH